MSAAVDQIAAAVPMEPVPTFSGVTAGGLRDIEFPPLKWAVAGLLSSGLALLVGAPKIGKSWLVLAIAMAVASGRRLFGLDVEGCEVVYFSLEDSPRRLQARLRSIGTEDWPDALTFVTDLPCTASEFLDRLSSYLGEHPGVKLVIIDTFQRVKSVLGSGNAYELDTAAIAPFHQIAKERDICILLVHHTRKSEAADPFEKVSGSQGLMGVADTTIMVEAARGKVDRILRVTGRDVPERDYAMAFEDGRWTMLGDAAEVAMSAERRTILAFVREAGHAIGPKDVADGTGMPYGSVKNIMPTMAMEGWLTREGHGKYIIPNASSDGESAPVPSNTMTS